jgi:hypothetical protein
MKPTVGRIVHYYPNEDAREPLAAIVTHVCGDGCVNLAVFHASGGVLCPSPRWVPLIEEGPIPSRNYCKWPERV